MLGSASKAPAGIKGFDTDFVVSPTNAHAFFAAGYRFAARYIPRLQPRSGDLSRAEIERFFANGLAVSPVQHVEPENWTPTDDKGRQYGATAANYCTLLGVPRGVTVWLDLEGVAIRTPAEQVIRYCNYWFDAVVAWGYEPGVYVGWQPILTGVQLYKRLKFARYWGAYNENADQTPIVRGYCMHQHVAKDGDIPPGVTIPIDTNITMTDHLNGLPTFYAPDEWSVK